VTNQNTLTQYVLECTIEGNKVVMEQTSFAYSLPKQKQKKLIKNKRMMPKRHVYNDICKVITWEIIKKHDFLR
jgi:hypothetical protein